MRHLTTILCVAACVLAPAQRPGSRDAALRRAPSSRKARRAFETGVCWVGGPNEAEMRRVRGIGVDLISLSPFAYGQRLADRVPEGGYQHSRHRGESLESIAAVAKQARSFGIRVMIKPHVWFARGGKWRGDIAFDDDTRWSKWFAAYEAFLEPYVAFAAKEKIAAFCLGTELVGTTRQTRRWRALIEKVRRTYRGKLTYAAHWDGEAYRIAFWSDLDAIGIQGYFPLVDFEDRNPTLAELAEGWKPWMAKLETLAERERLPVLVTEVGYQPRVGTTHRPWEWRSSTAYDPAAQATALEAFFRECGKHEFIAGAHVWKWFSYERGMGRNFSPQGLEGEVVIRRWFTRLGSGAGARSR